MFKKIFPLLRDIAIVIGGNIIYACGVAFFILPGGLITGGTTGIALFIQHLFGVPISTFVLCFNAVMFFMGLLVLGRKFAATTILSTFVYPIWWIMYRSCDWNCYSYRRFNRWYGHSSSCIEQAVSFASIRNDVLV